MRRAGITNSGSITSDSAVICHDRENITAARQHQAHDVRDQPGQRRGERLLGAEHVVVQAADQRAGLRPGEERQRHPLHVVEHRRAHVEDQALADPGGVPALGEGEDRVDDGQSGDDERDLDDHRDRAVSGDLVDHPAGQDRGRDADPARDDRIGSEAGWGGTGPPQGPGGSRALRGGWGRNNARTPLVFPWHRARDSEAAGRGPKRTCSASPEVPLPQSRSRR